MVRWILGVLLTASALNAADLTGFWAGMIPARNNESQDITFRFIQTGDTISGKLYRENGSAAIKEGKISADQISFTVTVDEQVGNLFLPTKYIFTGTITEDAKGKQVQLTRERTGPINNELGGNNPNRVNPKPTFVLRRVM
jgi:hypothetical protein